MNESTGVDVYIEALSAERRAVLKRLRALVLETVPDVTESMRYRMPTYERADHMVCAFASQKRYVSLYMDTGVVAEHRAALAPLDVGKSCIRFKHLEDLPLDLVGRMLQETLEKQRGDTD